MKAKTTYSICWSEFDRNDYLVTKTKDFKSEHARSKFIEKLEQKSNFNEILAYCEDWQERDKETQY